MQRILFALVAASVLFCAASAAELSVEDYQRLAQATCSGSSISLVESVPIGTNIPIPEETTYDSWLKLINSAQSTIEIAAFYITLTDGSQWPPEDGGYMGQNIFNGLVDAALKRNVSIRIVQQQPSPSMPDTDAQTLVRMGVATVRSINWVSLIGSGILHTKFMIVDGKSFYVGSSNFDWRSLAQVKELGVVVANCPTLANDISKIFDQYWIMSYASSMPNQWPFQDYTMYNVTDPFTFNSKDRGAVGVFMAASPPQMSISNWRTNDLDAILHAINSASQYVYFSVMDYAPTSLFMKPNFYWPLIDDALRTAAFQRNVTVRLLFSVWSQTKGSAYQWMRSLNDIHGIDVRVMIIPPGEGKPIPFTRVDHSKFIVTDSLLYITTSNCAADYFLTTGGVSITFMNENVRQEGEQIFMRDWEGPYSGPIPSWHHSPRAAPASTN
eukprot:TRINITY_DN987_c0_g1_i1.p1 TRINITY_DN987_c0_g1~~TRINITY_DN987_c0_g1_i1.p1  ORF type:complete len:441 (-),score=105.62 TRINITY_DN987_c0_g1_i1:14-1336(-)